MDSLYLIYGASAVCLLAGIWLCWDLRRMRKANKEVIKQLKIERQQRDRRRRDNRETWESTVELMSQKEIEEMQEVFRGFCYDSLKTSASSYEIMFEDSYALYQELAKLHRKYNENS